MGRYGKPTRIRIDPQRLSRRCDTQKVCHPTREAALDTCEAQMQAGRVMPGCHLVPYQCGRCGDWHVGNKTIVHLPGSRLRGALPKEPTSE